MTVVVQEQKAVELKPDMARKQVNIVSLLVILLIGQSAGGGVDESVELVVAGTTEYRPVMGIDNNHMQEEVEGSGGGRGRKLVPFQLCLVCKCCVKAGDPTTCANMPCCFGIDCQLPNKPYGVCAFVPKICNCTSCPPPN